MSERKVWIVEMPTVQIVEPGSQIMIEQFGDSPPSVAFRRDRWATWTRPFTGVVAP